MASIGAPFVLGIGLKMYLGHEQTNTWAREVADVARIHPAVMSGTVRLFVLPGFINLVSVLRTVGGSGVSVGAQDLFWEDIGPFTGEISGSELAEIGCSFVEAGHAERRNLFAETDQIVAAKVAAAFRNGLVPIVCVGEEFEQSADAAASECVRQLDAALVVSRDSGRFGELVVAYEPQWAIGALRPASVNHIHVVCERIREAVDSEPRMRGTKIIYGGSAGPDLLASLGDSVDGLFLGRSAHNPDTVRMVLDEIWAQA